MHITSQYLANEEKAVMAMSKVEALEAEAFGLKRDLIAIMDAHNTSKEQIWALFEQLNSEKLLVKQRDNQLAVTNQKMKVAVAKAVHAFQLTDEYNDILFGWYFKGFELLRRYLIKHGPGMDLEDLDFRAIDKEIEADEAAQAAVATGEDPPESEKDRNTMLPHPDLIVFFFFSFFFFFVGNAPSVLRLLDTFFICECPACFRAFEQFATLYICVCVCVCVYFSLHLSGLLVLLAFPVCCSLP